MRSPPVGSPGWRVALGGAVVCALACGGAPSGPLVVTWQPPERGRSTFEATRGSATYAGEVYGYEGEYVVKLERFPEDTKIAFGPTQAVVQSDVYDLVRVSVQDQLGALTFEQLEAFDPKWTLSIELADGTSAQTPLPPVSFAFDVAQMLEGAETRPIVFGAEPADPNPADSLYWAQGLSSKRWFGRQGTVQEVDFVAVSHASTAEKGRKVCSGYSKDDKAMPDVELLLKETEVVVYDRRTAVVVDRKVFAPNDECPMFAFMREDVRTKDSTPPYAAIEEWLRGKVKR